MSQPESETLNSSLDLNVGDTLRIFLDPTAGYNKDAYAIVETREEWPCRCFLKWEEIEKYVTEYKQKFPDDTDPPVDERGELIWVVEKIELVQPATNWYDRGGRTSFMEGVSKNSTHGAVLKLLTAENLAHIWDDERRSMNNIQQIDMMDGEVSQPLQDTPTEPFRIKVGLIKNNGIIYINHSIFFTHLCNRITGNPWGLNQVFSRKKKKEREKENLLSKNPSVFIAEKTGHRASEWGTYTATLGETHEQKEVEEIISALHVLYEEKDEFWGPQSDELEKAQNIHNFLKLLWEIPEAKQYHIDPLLKNYNPGDYVYDKVKEYIYSFENSNTTQDDLYAMSSDPETYWRNAQGGGRKKRRKRRKTKRKKSKRKKTRRRKSKKK